MCTKISEWNGKTTWPSWQPPPLPSWQGKSGVQLFDLDGMGSIPTIPLTQFTALLMSSINLHDDVIQAKVDGIMKIMILDIQACLK